MNRCLQVLAEVSPDDYSLMADRRPRMQDTCQDRGFVVYRTNLLPFVHDGDMSDPAVKARHELLEASNRFFDQVDAHLEVLHHEHKLPSLPPGVQYQVYRGVDPMFAIDHERLTRELQRLPQEIAAVAKLKAGISKTAKCTTREGLRAREDKIRRELAAHWGPHALLYPDKEATSWPHLDTVASNTNIYSGVCHLRDGFGTWIGKRYSHDIINKDNHQAVLQGIQDALKAAYTDEGRSRDVHKGAGDIVLFCASEVIHASPQGVRNEPCSVTGHRTTCTCT